VFLAAVPSTWLPELVHLLPQLEVSLEGAVRLQRVAAVHWPRSWGDHVEHLCAVRLAAPFVPVL